MHLNTKTISIHSEMHDFKNIPMKKYLFLSLFLLAYITAAQGQTGNSSENAVITSTKKKNQCKHG
jgi:hypothetical protein